MQFRAIYTYNPDIEEIIKLYGTGPKIINNDMIDKFYKYVLLLFFNNLKIEFNKLNLFKSDTIQVVKISMKYIQNI